MKNEKKKEFLKRVTIGTALFSLISGVGFWESVSMGHYATKMIKRNEVDLNNKVLATENFENFITEEKNRLINDYAEGKITFDELKAKAEGLYTYENAFQCAKASEDEDLQKLATDYERYKGLQERALTEGAPLMGGITFASIATCGASALSLKKIEDKEKHEEEESEM